MFEGGAQGGGAIAVNFKIKPFCYAFSQEDSLEIGHDETFDIEGEDDDFGHSQMSEDQDSAGEEEQNEVDSGMYFDQDKSGKKWYS